jgi:predicted nucleic acid-binding protein
MPLIVSDAGPLIALSRINRLGLLRELVHEVVVPDTVVQELQLDRSRPGVEGLAEALRKDRWVMAGIPADTRPIPGLGGGESAAIRLAEEMRCPLLIDERRGRIVAHKHGIAIIGTGRVLIAAKQKGLIDSVGPILQALQTAGYRLSDDLCARLRELAGEA